ncbi:unnamed protein product [Polarella glacialis]|uniref:Pentatricopeptide repeat-containing protein n=1 Tax=Polarella glacialis TaxID=89957 RepID=A0A813GC90_POLGL|nr:unnamed protein product [Polarella glacialis]
MLSTCRSCKSFFTGSTNACIVTRTVFLASMCSFVCYCADIRIPVPADMEEFAIVAVLLLWELFFNHRRLVVKAKDVTKKVSSPRPARKASASCEEGAASSLFGHICAAAKFGDVEAAEEFMERALAAGERPPGLVCYGALICSFAKAGQVRKAEHWPSKALEQAEHPGFPNSICLNMVIGACSKAGEVERAEHWLGKISAFGSRPDLPSYNAVIDACARQGKLGTCRVLAARDAACRDSTQRRGLQLGVARLRQGLRCKPSGGMVGQNGL